MRGTEPEAKEGWRRQGQDLASLLSLRPLFALHFPPLPLLLHLYSSLIHMALRPRLVRALGAYLTTHTSGLRVLPAAVSPPEAEALLAEVAKPLQRMRYAPAHFDNAIAGYRELRRREWSDANSSVLQRLQRAAEELAGTSVVFSPEVHVLDLAPEGAILPHVDSARFVGPVIAGLSLLSPAVMRFERHDDPCVA